MKQAQLEEREKALAAIDKELPAVLRELLGINYEREVNKYFVDADEENNRLSFLKRRKARSGAGVGARNSRANRNGRNCCTRTPILCEKSPRSRTMPLWRVAARATKRSNTN